MNLIQGGVPSRVAADPGAEARREVWAIFKDCAARLRDAADRHQAPWICEIVKKVEHIAHRFAG